MHSLAPVSLKGEREGGAMDNPVPKEAGASDIIINARRRLAVSQALNSPLRLDQSKSAPLHLKRHLPGR